MSIEKELEDVGLVVEAIEKVGAASTPEELSDATAELVAASSTLVNDVFETAVEEGVITEDEAETMEVDDDGSDDDDTDGE